MLNNRWYSQVPDEYRLAFLPVDSQEGKEYITWMNLALAYAFENRERMMERVKSAVEEKVKRFLNIPIHFGEEINCHHNYAALENHYGKNVWVHRKGATRAQKGEMAVIPRSHGILQLCGEGQGKPGKLLQLISWGRTCLFKKGGNGGIYL